jgi:AraC-like DNA-binding protein
MGVSLARFGVHAAEFANPDTRIPYRVGVELLEAAVRASGDPALGLKAGLQIESGDFDVVESAARSAPTFREGILCMARYFRLMNEASEVTLEESGETASWCHRTTAGFPQNAAVNDFVISSAATFARRNVSVWEPPIELCVTHEKPSYAEEYERMFSAPVRFGAAFTGFVIRRARLEIPMLGANPRVSAAFELHAQQLLNRLRAADGIAGRVRAVVEADLGAGGATMPSTAKRLAMSVATLRRRLEEEGTTYSEILDDLRKKLAERYVRDRSPAISEIAFLLGFSNVTAFHRAFRRWTGVAPSEYRARARVT